MRINESLHREIVAFLMTVGVSLETDIECGRCSCQVAPLTMPIGKSYQQVCIWISKPKIVRKGHWSFLYEQQLKLVYGCGNGSLWQRTSDCFDEKQASGLLHTVNICFAHSWLQPSRWLRSTTPTKTRLSTVKLQT